MSVTTEKAVLQVSFPKDKLEALKFYMDEKDTTVEKELQGHVKSIYEKYVPAATRRYLDRNDSVEGIQAEITSEPSVETQETAPAAPSVRGRRRNSREQNEENSEVIPSGDTTLMEENTEQVEEESQGMSMSM
ncbi:DUF6103 family protein [Lacrimispora defluvii]|uniref:Uncharacterized protein n=1 Tax=Lacrimispora defluvii TaxID=2719233 RepID=A0ABX1VUH5_9FIRM|nr:DUF6103 family protein [Lacrimispora defluvii]NNJ32058.1 hypothetical protein [Lacrimispora defluvii]